MQGMVACADKAVKRRAGAENSSPDLGPGRRLPCSPSWHVILGRGAVSQGRGQLRASAHLTGRPGSPASICWQGSKWSELTPRIRAQAIVQGCEIALVHVQVLPQSSEHRPNSRRLARSSARQLGEQNGLRLHEGDQTLHGGSRRQIVKMVEIAEHLEIHSCNSRGRGARRMPAMEPVPWFAISLDSWLA